MESIEITVSGNFSFRECLHFLNRNYDDCLYHIDNHSVTRAIRINERPILFRLREDNQKLLVDVLNDTEFTSTALITYVEEWLDCQRDIDFFYLLLKSNNTLAYMTTRFQGLRMIGIPDLFEALCWSVIGQQINLTFAYKLKRRFVEKYGDELIFEGTRYYLFPTPQSLTDLTTSALRELQFSRQKAEYVLGIATLFREGKLSKFILKQKINRIERLKQLKAVRGVGEWTANYVLMKSLMDPECIPYGDTGLFTALENHKLIDNRKEKEKIENLFAEFKGWESYLTFYLWRSL